VRIADPNMTIRHAARFMRVDNIGALSVGENDRLIGMDRDIVVRAVAEGRSADNRACAFMSLGLWALLARKIRQDRAFARTTVRAAGSGLCSSRLLQEIKCFRALSSEQNGSQM
jgi:hypothetical protein